MDATCRWIPELPPFENGFPFNTETSQLLLTIVLILAGLLLTYTGLRALKTVALMAGNWKFLRQRQEGVRSISIMRQEDEINQ